MMKAFLIGGFLGIATSVIVGRPLCPPCYDLGVRHGKITVAWIKGLGQ